MKDVFSNLSLICFIWEMFLPIQDSFQWPEIRSAQHLAAKKTVNVLYCIQTPQRADKGSDIDSTLWRSAHFTAHFNVSHRHPWVSVFSGKKCAPFKCLNVVRLQMTWVPLLICWVCQRVCHSWPAWEHLVQTRLQWICIWQPHAQTGWQMQSAQLKLARTVGWGCSPHCSCSLYSCRKWHSTHY